MLIHRLNSSRHWNNQWVQSLRIRSVVQTGAQLSFFQAYKPDGRHLLQAILTVRGAIAITQHVDNIFWPQKHWTLNTSTPSVHHCPTQSFVLCSELFKDCYCDTVEELHHALDMHKCKSSKEEEEVHQVFKYRVKEYYFVEVIESLVSQV